MKNSIARKLAIKLYAAFAGAFLLLMAGSFFLLRQDVKSEFEYYARVLVGVYSDVAVYESQRENLPIDLSFSDKLSLFGDYMCTWYRVDHMFAYVPDIENGTITYLSVSRKEQKYGEPPQNHMAGEMEEHILTANELNVWNGQQTYAVEKSRWLDRGTDVTIAFADNYGNKAMVGASVSTTELRDEMKHGFHIVFAFMFIMVLLLAMLLYFSVKRLVSDPARRISKQMSDYISGGKRSNVKLEIGGDDEFSMIAGAFNHMTEEIDKYIDDIAIMGREQERQQAEVDIASDIQRGILPPGIASLRNCGIKAVMKPAKFIGGDLYDYLELDSTHTLAVVADVSGKGISSALVMAVALTLIRQSARMGCSPAGILSNVNATLSEENPTMMFITAFVCIYDSDTRTLTYANAGHNPSYFIHGKPEVLGGSDGTPLGLFPDEQYTDCCVTMEEGDSVFLYTDGVNEAVNESGEFFGTGRLEMVLEEASATAPTRIVEAVEDAVRDFAGAAEQNDDITMLNLCARKKPVLELNYDVNEFDAIREYLFASNLPKELLMDLCVAAEECFVNICSYAFDGPAPEGEKIQFNFEYSNKVTMRFSDGGRRFDPRNGLPDTEEYDVDMAIGGLGRLIAFTIADSVDYEYRDGRNILTITKSI